MATPKKKEDGLKDESVLKEKEKALGLALTHIEKEFGKGAIMRLGDGVKVDIGSIPTGSLALTWLWVWEEYQGEE
jgi:hypothetical protein